MIIICGKHLEGLRFHRDNCQGVRFTAAFILKFLKASVLSIQKLIFMVKSIAIVEFSLCTYKMKNEYFFENTILLNNISKRLRIADIKMLEAVT